MIQVNDVSKRFGAVKALDSLTCTIPQGCIYGLVGSNGAGKSTLLRVVTGVYRPEKGCVTIDGQKVYEHPPVKSRFVFVPDDLFFLPQANLNRMACLYSAGYAAFDFDRFHSLVQTFGLDPKANLNTFSRGMRRQAASILALSCRTDYILFDETFDGLDPVMRSLVKKVIYADVCERGATAVITSHSLRELEDTCDHLAMLHNGRIVFESEVEHLKTSLFKVQVAFGFEYDRTFFEGIELLQFNKKGSVASFIVRGDRDEVSNRIKSKGPVLFDILPLSLEEVFVHELESLGYSFDEVLL